MFTDRRTVAGAGGVLAALVAMALSACAPVGSDGYGNQPVENAAAASGAESAEGAEGAEDVEGTEGTEEEAGEEPAKQAPEAPEDLTEELNGVKVPRMGKVVKDERGFILYRFDKDSNDPAASNCNDECERVWPPAYTDGNPVVKGINEERVGTVTRDDGTRQLTLGGWPLYYYIGDKKPGLWTGQAVGGVWFVVAPNGKKNLTCLPKGTPKAVDPPPADSGESSGKSSSDDGGYTY